MAQAVQQTEAGGRVPATNLAAKVKVFEAELKVREAAFAQSLPDHIPVASFMRNLLTAVASSPQLLECHRPSLFQAAMSAAALGLKLDKDLGHGYILPFRDGKSQRTLAQFIPGYRGYLHLARQSGEIASLSASEVCQNDHFEFELGLNERLVHKPATGPRGEVTHAYCIVRYREGGHHIEVMTRSDIERARSFSKSRNSPAWTEHFAMMARKTVIRRASKMMPLSVQRAAALDAAYDAERSAYANKDQVTGEIVIDGDFVQQDGDEPAAIEGQRQEHAAEPSKNLGAFKARQQQATKEPEPEPEPQAEEQDAGEADQTEPEPEPAEPEPAADNAQEPAAEAHNAETGEVVALYIDVPSDEAGKPKLQPYYQAVKAKLKEMQGAKLPGTAYADLRRENAAGFDALRRGLASWWKALDAEITKLEAGS